MKNPNGYGSVFKLSGNRRKPFAVRITTGWDDEGKQVYHYLGYYETRRKAMLALANYNNNPYDLSTDSLTFSDMFKLFKEERYNKISISTQGVYNMSYNLSEELHDLKFKELKKHHMQSVIDNCDVADSTKEKIRTFYKQLFNLGLENDIIHKDYSAFVKLSSSGEESSRKPFTKDEINLVWENLGVIEGIDTILIMIYTGVRPGELVRIKNNDINLEERYFRGGFKTAAGTDRVIPIHKSIHDLIARRMNTDNEYLIVNERGRKMNYGMYNYGWKKIMEKLNLDHTPHNCRHTFATIMDNAGANKTSIKRIMGHASKGVTNKVYTHKDLVQLLIAVDMLE